MDPAIQILVIEDDSSHAELIRRAFESSSRRFALSVASTLAEANSLLGRTSPDLIIADWRLPDGNGLDLLHGLGRRVPFVLMTSHGNERVVVDAMQAGALDYVVKSTQSLAELPHTADHAIREWRHRAERERFQAALEASERKYRFLADHVVDVIWTMDLQMRMTFVSPSAERLYGWTVEEWATLPPSAYLPPHSLAAAQQVIAEHLARPREAGDVEVTLELEQRRKDGHLFWAEIRARLLRDEQGTPAGIIGSTRDITERQKLEQQLAQAQKMEAIGVLAGGVAHDFNNILSAILGYASLIEMKMAPADPLRSDVEQILAAVERAGTLTQGLLAFSRKQPVKLEVVDLNSLISSFHRMLVRLIGEDIDFSVDLSAEPLAVRLNRGQLEQVLMNLVTNARDAMPGGGRLRISTAPVEIEKGRASLAAGRFALIAVADSGVGLAPDAVGRIFDPFYTTKEAGKGTGLGLSIVYGIVTRHGGAIDVSSEPGVGTTFSVYLPLVAEAGASVPREVRALPSGRSELILLAEDDDAVRPVVRALLERHGYVVLEAADGDAAVTTFAQHRDSISLVLCDVIMPKKNGKETWDAIRRLKPDAKVLFMSGYLADVVEETGLLASGVEVISKPVSPSDLLQTVRRTLDCPS